MMTRFSFAISLAIGQISVAIAFLNSRKPDADSNKEQRRQNWIKALKAASAALTEILITDSKSDA